MVNDSTELGKLLGNLASSQQSTRNEVVADDPSAQFNLSYPQSIIAHGQQRVYGYTYASDSFVLDHPIQGELDSSVYKLDGGYSNTGNPTILSISNDGDTWVFHGTSTVYVDTTNTTATVNTAVHRIEF